MRKTIIVLSILLFYNFSNYNVSFAKNILTSSGDSYTYPGYYGGTYDWDRGYISTIQEY